MPRRRGLALEPPGQPYGLTRPAGLRQERITHGIPPNRRPSDDYPRSRPGNQGTTAPSTPWSTAVRHWLHARHFDQPIAVGRFNRSFDVPYRGSSYLFVRERTNAPAATKGTVNDGSGFQRDCSKLG
ncbi:hypothetical protein GCM10010411_17400 [Actinomadura fulvescens]|uniref:Uncharacterized protein n=1 Tax=Actinomadura fulvescens TaxID=46160 RepID=A0ABN3PHT1_9ACTN